MAFYKHVLEDPGYDFKKGTIYKIQVTDTSRKVYQYHVKGYCKKGNIHLVRWDEKLKLEISLKIPKDDLDRVKHGHFHKISSAYLKVSEGSFRSQLGIIEHSFNKHWSKNA